MLVQDLPRDTDADTRLNMGLVFDVIQLLERHGYQRPEGTHARNSATGDTVANLLTLVRGFEGRA